MRWMARRARSTGQRARALIVLAAVVGYGIVFMPADVGAAAFSHRPGGLSLRQLPTISRSAQAFGGAPAVGALFTVSGGELGAHFCTASVVHSAGGDLAVTAAHCLTGIQRRPVPR